MRDDRSKFERPEPAVDGYDNGTKLRRTDEGGDELDLIGHEQANLVACLHPASQQGAAYRSVILLSSG